MPLIIHEFSTEVVPVLSYLRANFGVCRPVFSN